MPRKVTLAAKYTPKRDLPEPVAGLEHQASSNREALGHILTEHHLSTTLTVQRNSPFPPLPLLRPSVLQPLQNSKELSVAGQLINLMVPGRKCMTLSSWKHYSLGLHGTPPPWVCEAASL